MRPVFHCESRMTVKTTELRSGGMRYDLQCVCCGHREREVYTSTGKAVAWVNVSLQEKLAAATV